MKVYSGDPFIGNYYIIGSRVEGDCKGSLFEVLWP